MPRIAGSSRNDFLVGTIGNDTIVGFVGDDSIYGDLGNDYSAGGGGNDLIADDAGRDTLVGGDGDDYLQVRDLSGDTIFGGSGHDVAYVDRGTATSSLSYAFNEITGIGAGLNDGTTLTAIERTYLYLGSGNDTAAIVIDPNRGQADRSQVGFGNGNDLLRIDWSQFTVAVTMSGIPFTIGSNVRFLVESLERFSALSVERVEVHGSSSGDILYGFSLSDSLYGNDGHDVLRGEGGNDRVLGGTGNDILIGGAGADHLVGGTGNDAIQADAGNDTLSAGEGNDTLIGGEGSDTFVFNTRATRTNIDTIVDFNPLEDTIRLTKTAFAALQVGEVSPIVFLASVSGLATETEQRILYETGTGRLFYDRDGVGSAPRVHFATISPDLLLTELEFLVY